MMTRKNFEAIAAILAAQPSTTEVDNVIIAMADYLCTQNPNFDRARFLKACGF